MKWIPTLVGWTPLEHAVMIPVEPIAYKVEPPLRPMQSYTFPATPAEAARIRRLLTTP
jgi:hypothetical protein